jgi:hypothetical protein
MFSSKKKNVELNLMFISQANNIGHSNVDTPNLQQMVFPTRMSPMWLNLICLAISHAHGHGHGAVIDPSALRAAKARPVE